ncbi:Hap5p [Sugiyamaella lignohabitans]|uniref:Hap5p n=1 Tax=Sugiyamaella lignohabitans TaxID=796027 RepID=A0A167FE48_9ASCO|nr:Hap5p [Sugiyamaella lignohabitans]ANB15185.1 Hap5p [Sugiyamaella lignohabitans]
MNEIVDDEYGAEAPLDDSVAYGEADGVPLGESDSFSNVAQGLTGHHKDLMMQYWQDTINSIEHDDHKFKIHQLPLARIKKVMKADEDVKMISAEAPILFAKGCDIFITELTMRAWIHAEENKRRTLQRSDIASALQKSDMFDFLIDIVPREEALAANRRPPNYQDMYQEAGSIPGYVDEQNMSGLPHSAQDVSHDELTPTYTAELSQLHHQQQPSHLPPHQQPVHHQQQQLPQIPSQQPTPQQHIPSAQQSPHHTPQPQSHQPSSQHSTPQPGQQPHYNMDGSSVGPGSGLTSANSTPGPHPQGPQQDYNQVYPQHSYSENIDYNGYRQY